MKKTTIILITVIAFGVVFLLASLVHRGNIVMNENNIAAPVNDPLDVVSELADGWLDNLQATTSISLTDFLGAQTGVTAELKEKLIMTEPTSDRDVILCQAEQPKRVGAKSVFLNDRVAQVMIVPRGGEKTPERSIVDLTVVDAEWVISDITCSMGEAGGPVGEFSFEQTGRLVRDSVPAPYDSTVWHLIFSQTDGTVQVVQLLFDEMSQCATADGEVVCSPDTLVEGAASFVQADMTEAGALVRKLDSE